jgi:hypothetical protein
MLLFSSFFLHWYTAGTRQRRRGRQLAGEARQQEAELLERAAGGRRWQEPRPLDLEFAVVCLAGRAA